MHIKSYNKIILTISCIGLLASCGVNLQVDKRKHLKGFHVELTKKHRRDYVDVPEGRSDIRTKAKEGSATPIQDREPESGITLVVKAERTTADKDQKRKLKALLKQELAESSVTHDNTIETWENKGQDRERNQVRAEDTSLQSPGADVDRKTHAGGVASLTFGIIALVTFPTILFSLLFALLAIIFGIASLSKITKYPEKYVGKGFGSAGIFLGVMSIVLMILFISFIINIIFAAV